MINDELLNKCATNSEKETASFFDKIGLKCIDLCFKIKTQKGADVTDIDGIFLDEENEVIIIYDDSEKSDSNPKILNFISKCKENRYEDQIYKYHPELPYYPIYILYIDKSRDSYNANTASIEHVFDNSNKIIFKDDFDYFKDLSERLGEWAKNDLYNFVEIFPPNNRMEIDAIKIYIGDSPAYLLSDKPHNILRYSYVSRRRGNDNGYQRMIDYERVKNISNRIKNKEITGFPNSILLNSTVEITENTTIPRSHCPKATKIILPNHYSSCRIVDGQHRLISFSQLTNTEQSKYNLSVVLLNNLPIQEEKKLFLEINNNAKNVDPNIGYEIISELDHWEKGSKEYLIKNSVKIISELEKISPIKNNIYRGTITEEKNNQITIKSFVDSIIKHKLIDKTTGFFQKKEDDFETPIIYLKEFIIEANKKINDKEYLASNRGIDIICSFWSNIVGQNNNIDIKQLIDKYNIHFCEAIDNNINEIRKKYGAQGAKEAFDIINKYIESKTNHIINNCKKDHSKTDELIKKVSINQGGSGRHKCASCAYEIGFNDGKNGLEKQDINKVNETLPYSQKAKRRHRSTEEAYNLGYLNGKKERDET